MSCTCSIGRRPDAATIDAQLVVGASLNTVVKAVGNGLVRGTLGKHRQHCLGIRGDTQETGAATPAETAETSRETGEQAPPSPRLPPTSPYSVPNPGDDALTAPRKVVTADVERRAIDMRAKGASYTEIADALHVSECAAQDAVERVLVRTRKGTNAKADLARQLDLRRIDRLISAVWDRAMEPPEVEQGDGEMVPLYEAQDKAVDKVTKLLERRAKLLGLDAPQGLRVSVVDAARESEDFGAVYAVIFKALAARYPGASEFVSAALDAFRDGGDAGVDAFLAGDLAVVVKAG